MKTFIIINGREIYLINANDLNHAKDKALHICNQSNEIIIREYNNINDFTIK
jgi:hypothetical protein